MVGRCFRHKRSHASPILDGLFARLSASADPCCAADKWQGGSYLRLRSFLVLANSNLLLDGRAHVLAALALRARNGMGFSGFAAAWRRHCHLRVLDRSIRSWIFRPTTSLCSLGLP